MRERYNVLKKYCFLLFIVLSVAFVFGSFTLMLIRCAECEKWESKLVDSLSDGKALSPTKVDKFVHEFNIDFNPKFNESLVIHGEYRGVGIYIWDGTHSTGPYGAAIKNLREIGLLTFQQVSDFTSTH